MVTRAKLALDDPYGAIFDGDDAATYSTHAEPLVEIIIGVDAIDELLGRISTEATTEVNAFIIGRDISEDRSSATRQRNSEMYARGVRSRAIYLTRFRDGPAILEHVLWINKHGSEVRTFPTLPTQMIIADRKLAVLPHRLESGEQAVIVHRDPEVVKCLATLFESTWTSATPLGAVIVGPDTPISRDERTVLDLLAIGRIDKEISQTMGVHPRTIARTVAELMARLNAKTRFQAGVKAAKRHWI